MNRVQNLRVRPDLLYVSSGWNVLITDVRGRITGTDPQGFYARNARVLSRERLLINGQEPEAFSTAKVGAHAQLSYVQLEPSEQLPRRGVYFMLERFVGEGLRTKLRFESYSDIGHRFQVGVELGADFADTDEAEKGERHQRGHVITVWDAAARQLRLRYDHPGLTWP